MAEMAIPTDIRATARQLADDMDRWLKAGNSIGHLSEHAVEGLADTFERALLAEREAQKEKDAKIASGWKRRCLGRDINKATWDPCGRWDGGLVMENGRERDLIAAAIRRQEDGNG